MTDETDVYTCGICKKEFQDFVTFLQHKSSFGVFKCKLCNLSYHDREDIQEHINSSHNNQKVDVVFTIPTKDKVVKSDLPDETKESIKSGAALSVYTCRLCNRFTLVERIMLGHLQNVHKIHVTPNSVELAALMLCSKPLDASSIPKLTGSPLVVKTVTTPVIAQKTTTSQAIGTQTYLTSVNMTDKVDWQEVNEETIAKDSKQTPAAEIVSPEVNAPAVAKTESNNGSVEVQTVAMTSILKSNVSAHQHQQQPEAKAERVVSVESMPVSEPVAQLDVEQVVCIDGGHDYASITEKLPLESKGEIVTELGEEIEDEEEGEIILTPSTKKYAGKKNASEKPTQAIVNVPQVTVAKQRIELPKRPAMKSISRSTAPSQIKRPLIDKSDESDIDEEDEVINEEPQPGMDGMYHCRECNRAFARERQFKAHMNVHVMYGEHYLESPGGGSGSRYDTKPIPHKKKGKYE